MTTYLALARKWRPHAFNEIVGQSHVVTALQNALSQKKIHHAYLLTGTHGVGKTTLARIFAKSLNCESGITATPCNQCTNCQEIDAGRFPDLYEIDAASRTKVEDTRELLDNVPYAPTKGRFKVYLIDEVHMLSGHSFNALLKTLEEPPEHVKFLLATTDPQKLPATVLSRCLQFHLSQLLPEQIEEQLAHILAAESIHFEKPALTLLSQSANGSMRDALSLLDQCIAYCNGNITTEQTQQMLGLSHEADIVALITAIDQQDAETALALTQTCAQNGINFSKLLTSLLTTLHDIAVAQALSNSDHALANTLSPDNVQLYYQIAAMGQKDLPFAPSLRAGFEMIVIRMMAFKPDLTASVQPTIQSKKTNPASKKPRAATPLKATQQNNSTTTSNDWNTLLNQLNLTGPTLAFAQQCTLESIDKHTAHFHLKPQFKALLNDRQKARLENALTQHFNRDIKIKVDVAEFKAETPAESAQRIHTEKTESAKKAMQDDPTVKRMMQQFDATLIEGSVEPL